MTTSARGAPPDAYESVIAIIGDSRGAKVSNSPNKAGSIELSPAAADAIHVGYGRENVTTFNSLDPSKSAKGIRITFLGNTPKKLSVRKYDPTQ